MNGERTKHRNVLNTIHMMPHRTNLAMFREIPPLEVHHQLVHTGMMSLDR